MRQWTHWRNKPKNWEWAMTDEVFAFYCGVRCACCIPGRAPGFTDVAGFVWRYRARWTSQIHEEWKRSVLT